MHAEAHAASVIPRRAAIAALGVASAVAAIRIGHSNLDRAYYGTDTRADQLLAGAFLALTPQLFRLRVVGGLRPDVIVLARRA